MEELSFSDKVTHGINNSSTLTEGQARVREIFYRYSISSLDQLAHLPQHVSHALWAIITGDPWGKFRAMINRRETFNPSDEQVTHKSM